MSPEIPIYSINAYLYCKYRYYLEEIVGLSRENKHITKGALINEIKTKKSSTKNWKKIKKIFVASEKFGIYGYIDNIVKTPEKTKIVEVKKGKSIKPFESDVIQLVAYMMAYCETYSEKPENISGILKYEGSKKTFRIHFTEKRLKKLYDITRDIQKIKNGTYIPSSMYTKKCKECSLFEICQPSEKEKSKMKIMPSKFDKEPIFIFKHGVFIGKSGENFQISYGEEKVSIPSYKIYSLNIFGIFSISKQAIELASKNNIPIIINSSYGKNISVITPYFSKNNFLRIKHLKKVENTEFKMELTRKIIYGKIKNMEIFLKKKKIKINFLKYKKALLKEKEIGKLRGIEGAATKEYFEYYKKLIPENFTFKGRKRRPPTDEINSLLSFGYTILYNIVYSLILSIGVDPYFGFLHTTQYGRASLALDLMEEFRTLLIDSVVLSVINKKIIKKKDFKKDVSGAIFISQSAKKIFVEQIFKRIKKKHYYKPAKISIEYIRIIEAQIRMFQKAILDEMEYIPFTIER
ncbi:CRISPR-associated endonuclease Cas4/Cas1 [Marinitoga sp. 1155]|uniref:CRISPR-associated endonuclease Cas4/Cas1 n=1 Tax=Marinitoga sp. 1155 TaxID=1428448 RepID=UPI00064179DB|nr:CRISPR-associated endonuclease Cas4/Cas1 [Marinitoga sp. 1155]KLO24765.1 hypothetical protein X274_02020 [Marinitoga sp. 1155]